MNEIKPTQDIQKVIEVVTDCIELGLVLTAKGYYDDDQMYFSLSGSGIFDRLLSTLGHVEAFIEGWKASKVDK